MSGELDWQQMWDLFDDAKELEGDERAALIDERCRYPEQRRQIEEWLAAETREHDIFDGNALDALARDARESSRRLIGQTLGEYEVIDMAGSGASSFVYKARQRRLDRVVALKLLRTALLDDAALKRFEQETKILARLRHPSIVPVFDAAFFSIGHTVTPYLALEWIDGTDVVTHCDSHDLTREARLALLARICDAIQHAHEHGIVHRDLKPANILVDADHVPHIVDFGIARTLGAGTHTLTAAGQMLGTPSFMAPEQALAVGVDRRADVYALGAIAFRLIANRLPVDIPSSATAARLRELAETPRPRLRDVVPDVSRDLTTIIDKALSVRPRDRYATAGELADDLRRCQRREPIAARPATITSQLAALMRRYRTAFAIAGVVLASLVVATLISTHFAVKATAAVQRFELLMARDELNELSRAGPSLWPLGPATTPAIEEWLVRADAFVERRSDFVEALEALRLTALPWSPAERAADAAHHEQRIVRAESIEEMADALAAIASTVPADDPAFPGQDSVAVTEAAQRERAAVERARALAARGTRHTWRYRRDEDAWLDAKLDELVRAIDRFTLPSSPSRDYGVLTRSGVERALAYARQLEPRTVDAHAKAWADARAAIADVETAPWYGGLRLDPIVGLIPLGPDPHSGLWEFAHLASGPPVRRDPESGALFRDDATGLVLVLIPGGEVTRGATADLDEARRLGSDHVDPWARADEFPLGHSQLDPFFMSKFETTQRQWSRMDHGRVSRFMMDNRFDDERLITGLHPVESVTWRECQEVARRFGLELPTEAQWEHAARAGTTSPHWFATHRGAASENLADAAFGRWLDSDRVVEPWDDGVDFHAPTGSYESNAFGLHDMLGNVREWTRDAYLYYDDFHPEPGTGELYAPSGDRVVRGGSYRTCAARARCAFREGWPRTTRRDDLGTRFSLAVIPRPSPTESRPTGVERGKRGG